METNLFDLYTQLYISPASASGFFHIMRSRVCNESSHAAFPDARNSRDFRKLEHKDITNLR